MFTLDPTWRVQRRHRLTVGPVVKALHFTTALSQALKTLRKQILANPLRYALLCCPYEQKWTLCTWLAPSLWLHTEEDLGVWGMSL